MCGCNKKLNANRRSFAVNGSRIVRTNPATLSVQGGSAAGATPEELRALGLQNNTNPKENARVNADKRRIEKLRRDAIRNALNK